MAVRQRFALSDDRARTLLRAIHHDTVLEEALVLQTCNRTEIYFVAPDPAPAVPYLLGLVARTTGAESPLDAALLYRHDREEAVGHLFRVAGGLDSQVVGEPQILAQLKTAYRVALEERTARFFLNKLLHAAFRAGKRVRTETELSGALSVPRAAAALVRETLGDPASRSVLLIGAGPTAELTARALLQAGVRKLTVANRSLPNARLLADRLLNEPRPGESATVSQTSGAQPFSPGGAEREPFSPGGEDVAQRQMRGRSEDEQAPDTGDGSSSGASPQASAPPPTSGRPLTALAALGHLSPRGEGSDPLPDLDSCPALSRHRRASHRCEAETGEGITGSANEIPAPIRNPQSAIRHSVLAVSLDSLPDALRSVDAVLSATGSPTEVLRYDALAAPLRRRRRPLLLVDLAVPRDIDPRLAKLPCVTLRTLDDLNAILADHRRRQDRHLPLAEAILAEETGDFARWIDTLQVTPAIKLLKRRFAELHQRETRRYASRFVANHASEELERFARSLANKILHHPIAYLRDTARTGTLSDQLSAVETVRRMFDLDEPEPDA